jgi:hexosaminidase
MIPPTFKSSVAAVVFAASVLAVSPIEAQKSAIDSTSDASSSVSLGKLAETFSPAEHLDLRGDQVGYRLPRGVTATIVGTTYEQVIGINGKIRRPLSAITSKVTFELSNGKEKATTAPQLLTIPGRMKPGSDANPKPEVIPALQEWVGTTGVFTPGANARIVIRSGDGRKGKPTLHQRMEIFARDFEELTGKPISVVEGKAAAPGDFFVTLEAGAEVTALGVEGATLAVTDSLKIHALDPIGAFWATRTILQVFKQHQNTFPRGFIADYPQYPLRGFVYDVARKPAKLEAIRDVMKVMSYYKLNDFQLHLNDNFIWLHEYSDSPNEGGATAEQKQTAIQDVMKAAPTAFRLESDIKGKDGTALTSSDYYFTKDAFGKLIDESRAFGVNIVPELDIPGHALSFVRVRPDLMYRGKVHKSHDVERAAMLDASTDVFDPKTGRTYREETLAFIEGVFDEYLVGKNGKPPVFRDAVVHIGTDEYYGEAEDYRAFADALLKYVKGRGFTPRLWGSLNAKPGKTPILADGVQMHVWSLYWQQPQPAINAGFDIINVLDVTSYVVPNGTGNVGGYGDLLNLQSIYSENWQPNIMQQQVVIPGHPKMLGAQWALWNDNSFRRDTGLIDFDLFERIHQNCAVFAEKTWSTGENGTYPEFMKRVASLDLPPNANPRHAVKFKGGTLIEMEFEGKLDDGSGNAFHAKSSEGVTFEKGKNGQALALNGGRSFVKSGVENVAPGYTAEFWVKRESDSTDPQVLFSSATGTFYAVQKGTGKIGISRDTWDYSFDYTLPVNQWVKLNLVSAGRSLTLFADDQPIGSPKRHLFPESHKFNSFIFPLEFIGAEKNAFKGQLDSLKITKAAPPDMSRVIPHSSLRATASSEQGSGPDGDISKAFDGDATTYWHSRYSPKDPAPFEIVVQLEHPETLDTVSFLPRQGNNNGAIQAADLFLLNGEGSWDKIASYSGGGDETSVQGISFPPRKTRAVKLVIRQGVAGFGTLAELNLHRAP